jgi:hypothetical protein
MGSVTCGEVRQYLAGLSSGPRMPLAADAWQDLATKGAISGSPTSPTLTPVGQHVLQELNLRATRCDGMTLDAFADQLGRVLGDLDTVAKTAEYFLAELGALTPPEAVPLLRPVTVGLANRRETPQQLAEEFRDLWGSVEVMGGSARDRLIAADLLHLAGVPVEKIYSPMMTTAATVRELGGPSAPGVSVAAILHLNPDPEGAPRMAEYLALRKIATTEEGAAMLAAAGLGVESATSRRGAFLQRLGDPAALTADHRVAAGYLTVCGAQPDRHLPRMEKIARGLPGHLPLPHTLSAVLAMADWLEVGELLDWVSKASTIAQQRKLAPTPAELTILGVSLVLGLPSNEFGGAGDGQRPLLSRMANIVVLNSWIYAGILGGAAPGQLASAR